VFSWPNSREEEQFAEACERKDHADLKKGNNGNLFIIFMVGPTTEKSELWL